MFKEEQDKTRRNGAGIEITVFGWGLLYKDINLNKEVRFECTYVSQLNSLLLITNKPQWSDYTSLSSTEQERIAKDLKLAFPERSNVSVSFDG